ncbi:hypothetical protein AMS68_002278 [Peltaster fructicola]|uniref:non-reducing end alpha-L-arabinofuranosidase n=1 Tax=Peltaster fructicola TaxID=286661 RepID=A0A6H0XQ35_9PEZI|nr:hypothetical protein AMS68_002278 [Peltaster fructicola]
MLCKSVLFTATVVATVHAITLTVSSSGGNASSPYLYGIMFEDINNSGDGALYSQQLRNNGFQGDNPGLAPFDAVGAAKISQDNNTTIGTAKHPTVLVSFNQGATGQAGLSNGGYYGIRVWLKGVYDGDAVVSLVSESGSILASSNIGVSSNAHRWSCYQAELHVSTAAPNGNNSWQITFDPAKSNGHINVGFPLLYPPTYKDRVNGMDNEVANGIAALQPSFMRLPGGNNLEGATVADRWIWNNTVGPVQDRPGRQGDWSYPNTDGLGLMEYLNFCEDVGMTPLLALWDGLTLGGGVVTGSALEPFVQDALNELEFVLGDSSTPYGSWRARLGHPQPYDVEHIEIGNEDFLNDGTASYDARFQMFYNAIHANYPQLTFVATTAPQDSDSGIISNPGPQVWQDVHHYWPPHQFIDNFNEFDNWDRNKPLIVGEYASTTHDDGSQTYWQYMQASVAEAVYMIGMERNSDVVRMASYAPLLEHFGVAEWSPDLYGYDPTNGVTRSTSYFVQQLFSVNRGDTIHEVVSDAAFGPVYWVASSKGDAYYVKLANYGSMQQTVDIHVAEKSHGTLSLITGSPNASNYPGQETVKPVTSNVNGQDGCFSITLPACQTKNNPVTMAAHEGGAEMTAQEPMPVDAQPKSYLDLINECDNFPYYHSNPESYLAHLDHYYALKVAQYPDVDLGYLLPSVAETFRGLTDWNLDEKDRALILVTGESEQERSQIVALTVAAMRDTGHFEVLKGWRDELYPVYGPNRDLLFSIERSASPLFGILSYGCHLTAYTRSEAGIKIWTPRRAATKQTYGGMLDNTVAGGMATGDVVPKPSDDEVAGFELKTIQEVKAALRDGGFKPNCALVLLDFFVRHGILTAHDEGYLQIVPRLHRVLEFPTM